MKLQDRVFRLSPTSNILKERGSVCLQVSTRHHFIVLKGTSRPEIIPLPKPTWSGPTRREGDLPRFSPRKSIEVILLDHPRDVLFRYFHTPGEILSKDKQKTKDIVFLSLTVLQEWETSDISRRSFRSFNVQYTEMVRYRNRRRIGPFV